MLFFDHALLNAINAQASTPASVVDAARWLSLSLPSWLGGFYIAGLVFGRRNLQRGLLQILLALLLASLIAYLLRNHWPSLRPAQLGWGIQWIEHSSRAGFPSMHATLAFTLAQGLTITAAIRRLSYGRWLAAAGWACAFAISWSRVCLGVHLPSDVIGGAALGISSATLVALAVRHIDAASPVTARGRFSAYWSHLALPWVRHK